MHPRPHSDSLADLVRANEQKRDAALLRAMTELYVLDARHTADEYRRYEELALHFLPKVALEDRSFVAERLATCSDAPHAVVVCLARDVIDVASPVIRHSPVLQPIDLLAMIAATSTDHHRLISQRQTLPADVLRALTIAEERRPQTDADSGSPRRDEEASARPDRRSDLLDPWRFLGLDRRGRLAVIAELASSPSLHSKDGQTQPEPAFRSILGAARIVGFARSGQLPAIVAAISEGLGLTHDLVAAAVNDSGGDLLAVMLKALRLDDVQARQVLLLTSPTGHDVAAFFPLADLFAGLEVSTAEMLVSAWREVTSATGPRHQPHFADNAKARRMAVTESRRTMPSDNQARRA